MASSRILNSKVVNKLQVNRLDAQAIRSDNIKSLTPSYLFSSVFNNAAFNRNNTGGTLTFTRSDVHSIIQFSDRPFRQTDNITFEEFVSLFDTLGNNSFEQDPPNAVLVHEEEQRTYIVRLASSDSNSATFNLELLPGESHNLGDVNGRMSLFVDGGWSVFDNGVFDTVGKLYNAIGKTVVKSVKTIARESDQREQRVRAARSTGSFA